MRNDGRGQGGTDMEANGNCWSVVAAIGVVAAAGCMDGGAEEVTIAAMCATACGKAEMCWSYEVDEARCLIDCERDVRRSAAMIAAMNACYEDLTCSDIDNDAEWDRCILREMGDRRPSAAGAFMCEAGARRLEECFADRFDEAEERARCERYGAPYLSDGYAAELTACYFDVPCAEVFRCVDEAAVRFGAR